MKILMNKKFMKNRNLKLILTVKVSSEKEYNEMVEIGRTLGYSVPHWAKYDPNIPLHGFESGNVKVF